MQGKKWVSHKICFVDVVSIFVMMAKLQIRGGIEDNSKIIILFLNENICCDPSLEPSRRDGSNGGSKHTF